MRFNLKKISFIILCFALCFSLVSCKELSAEQVERLKQLKSEREVRRLENISEYQVVSVCKYLKTTTNNFGGILRQDIYYNFQYIDSNGQLKTGDIQHLEYGLTKVCLGDKDVYVVDTNSLNTYKYLYLTKNTLNNFGYEEE